MKNIREARMSSRFSGGFTRHFENLVYDFVKEEEQTLNARVYVRELDRSGDIIKGYKVEIADRNVIVFKLMTVAEDVIYKINDLASGECWIGTNEKDLERDIQDLISVNRATLTESDKRRIQEESNEAWGSDDIDAVAQGYVDDYYEDLSIENVRADLENEPYFSIQQEEIDDEEDEDIAAELQEGLDNELDEIADRVWERYQELLAEAEVELKENKIKSGRVISAPDNFDEYTASARDCVRYELEGTPFSRFLDENFCERVTADISESYEKDYNEVKEVVDYYKRQAEAEVELVERQLNTKKLGEGRIPRNNKKFETPDSLTCVLLILHALKFAEGISFAVRSDNEKYFQFIENEQDAINYIGEHGDISQVQICKCRRNPYIVSIPTGSYIGQFPISIRCQRDEYNLDDFISYSKEEFKRDLEDLEKELENFEY